MMRPPSVAHAEGNATLDRTYDTEGPVPDVATGGMKAHQVDEEMVKAREVVEQLAFVEKDSHAVVLNQTNVPAEMMPAWAAALTILMNQGFHDIKEQVKDVNDKLIKVEKQVKDVNDKLIKVEKQVDDFKEQLIKVEEQVDDVKEQLIQVKKQVDDVKDQLIKVKDQLIEGKMQGNSIKKRLDYNSKIVLEVLDTVTEKLEDAKKLFDTVKKRIATNRVESLENHNRCLQKLTEHDQLLVRLARTVSVLDNERTRNLNTSTDSTAPLTPSSGSASSTRTIAIGLPESTLGSAPSNADGETGATPTTSSPASSANGGDSA